MHLTVFDQKICKMASSADRAIEFGRMLVRTIQNLKVYYITNIALVGSLKMNLSRVGFVMH